MSAIDRQLPASWRCVVAFILGGILGMRVRKWLYAKFLGYSVHPGANLGICYVRVVDGSFGSNSDVGHFSVIRNLHALELGEGAVIGTFNWIFGMVDSGAGHFASERDRKSALILEAQSALTSRHIIDCTNRVVIGAFTTVAGFNTHILTHGISVQSSRQQSAPVIIGRYCLIGSRVTILKGSVIPDYSVVGAGSVFRGRPAETHRLYSGVPATAVKVLDSGCHYFTREVGRVS